MAFNYEKLTVEQDGMVVVAAINHPPANSMGQGVLRDLNDLLDKCEKDDNVRAIIITGTGPKLFSAGADITEFAGMQSGKVPEYDGNQIYFKIENYPKVIIAAMQGSAYGGGLELACVCHLRIMAEEATLGLPEVKLGLNPGWGGTQRLPRFIGKTKALELMLTGDFIPAKEALALGLLNKVVPAADVLETAKKLAKRIANGAPVAQREIMKAVRLGLETTVVEGVTKIELAASKALLYTEDFKEGAKAFLEKRAPKFQGK
ncbi:MAG: enoyl-CoA hydratase/isomerase family protein [Proteobacteria bacterium]|nr:enoyl-CoA hydratase/isomerase family protein [Pseudomonadota bacterium]MBU1388413.1 enoyl-CoA hydratase/isomerase family protein [Pseudomonadota bacterium]MBU1542763.1 enoyl-CoA hydratase/isomerase family protein [Pseudomonadota bacterium]MBU2482160.1 enoyl-CoA hydratase/isomerase family protein [Pseudomonadota bacterium]